jgi:hypothetical protein
LELIWTAEDGKDIGIMRFAYVFKAWNICPLEKNIGAVHHSAVFVQ